MSDIYYNPQACGLRKLVEIDEPGLSYEFNILCVWQDIKSGKLYWQYSSGCSCPSPFEDYHSSADLNELRTDTFDHFHQAVLDFPAEFGDQTKAIQIVKDHLDDFFFWVREIRDSKGLE